MIVNMRFFPESCVGTRVQGTGCQVPFTKLIGVGSILRTKNAIDDFTLSFPFQCRPCDGSHLQLFVTTYEAVHLYFQQRPSPDPLRREHRLQRTTRTLLLRPYFCSI